MHQRIVRIAGLVQLPVRLLKIAHVHVNQRAIVTGHHVRRRIETHQAIITAQRASILAIQPMQRRFDKMDHRLVRRFPARARDFFARLLLFTAPQVNKNHQHARFDDLRIDRQRLGESHFSAFVVFRAAKAFENSIDVTGAEAVMRQRKVWIEFDRALKMFDGGVAIFLRDSAENETRKKIATAQVLFVSGGVLR